jgi:hypothetical protein
MLQHKKYNRKSDCIFNKTFPGSTLAEQNDGSKNGNYNQISFGTGAFHTTGSETRADRAA